MTNFIPSFVLELIEIQILHSFTVKCNQMGYILAFLSMFAMKYMINLVNWTTLANKGDFK